MFFETTKFARRLPLTFCSALLVIGAVQLRAATKYVGTCAPGSYPTIQAAVNASSPGTTINICPGIYPEQVIIKNTHDLNLVGIQAANAQNPVITPPDTFPTLKTVPDLYAGGVAKLPQVLVQNSFDIDISTLAVDGTGNGIAGCGPDLVGIYYQNASGVLNYVVARNQILAPGLTGCQSGEAIFIQSGYGSAGFAAVSVQNSSIHNYEKNGITGDGNGTFVLISGNDISGVRPTTGAAENGIQVSDGAVGKVVGNTVVDNVWAPDQFGDTGDAASGILIYASQYVTVTNNTVATTQYGIATVTDSNSPTPTNPDGLADHTTITGNNVLNTLLYDAIDVCSNNNDVDSNTIFNGSESGIHLDSSCGSSGKNNSVKNNVINESCAGILLGNPANSLSSNTIYNVTHVIFPGDVCQAATSAPAISLTPNVATPSAQPHFQPAR